MRLSLLSVNHKFPKKIPTHLFDLHAATRRKIFCLNSNSRKFWTVSACILHKPRSTWAPRSQIAPKVSGFSPRAVSLFAYKPHASHMHDHRLTQLSPPLARLAWSNLTPQSDARGALGSKIHLLAYIERKKKGKKKNRSSEHRSQLQVYSREKLPADVHYVTFRRGGELRTAGNKVYIILVEGWVGVYRRRESFLLF